MLIEYLADKVIGNEKLITTAFGCAVIYILMSNENTVQRLISGLSGFLAAIIFSPLLSDILSNGEGAHIYSAGIALCGQFVPQLIQKSITKIKHTDIYDAMLRLFKK